MGSVKRFCAAIAAALLFAWGSVAHAQLTITRADHLHCVGDSITVFGWCQQADGFGDQIQAHWKPSRVSGVGTVTGGRATASGGRSVVASATPQLLTLTSNGLIGGGAADIASNVPAYITTFSPTVVVILLGINDADHGTDPNAFATSYTSILTQTHTALPSTKIGCLSLVANGEQWQANGGSEGGHWGPNAFDAAIATLDTKIQTVCTGTGYSFYIPIRPQLGTWETTHNGSAPGSTVGSATFDGIHPTQVGQYLIGSFIVPQITIGP